MLLGQVSPLKRKFILKGTGLVAFLLLSISFGSKNFDILVVGNGVVGLSAACTLKMLSFDVAIISAFQDGLKEKRHTSERNLTIVESSRRFLNAIGVWKTLRDSVLESTIR